jgi:hypothetical protein
MREGAFLFERIEIMNEQKQLERLGLWLDPITQMWHTKKTFADYDDWENDRVKAGLIIIKYQRSKKQ